MARRPNKAIEQIEKLVAVAESDLSRVIWTDPHTGEIVHPNCAQRGLTRTEVKAIRVVLYWLGH